MKILSIETSCDETAVAIVEATGGLDKPKFQVLAKAVNSQIDIHKEFGGVFPSVAKREHAKNIVPVTKQCFEIRNTKYEIGLHPPVVIPQIRSQDYAGSRSSKNNDLDPASPCPVNGLGVRDDNLLRIKEILNREEGLFEATIKFLSEYEKPDVDMIAVTSGPGLEPALWVGINFARALSIAWDIPLLPVNHMEGHIASVLLSQNGRKSEIPPLRQGFAGRGNPKLEFPALALLISGGHTELVEIKNWNQYKILGKTRDDAVGESYDKVARLMGFPYPGGPQISAMAQKFRNQKSEIRNQKNEIKFPRPMINSGDLDFSFSGLKTAVLYKVQGLGVRNPAFAPTSLEFRRTSKATTGKQDLEVPELSAGEFEQAVVDVLISKLGQALNLNDYKNIITAGGVVANSYIRENIFDLAKNYGINALFPDLADSTDNAQMIACAGYFKIFKTKPEIGMEIKAEGNLSY